jgi:hypothetical protein
MLENMKHKPNNTHIQYLIVVLEWGTFLSNNIYIVFGNIPVRLVKFERNFTKCNFYVITEFMSKRNFYFETQGVDVREHEIQTKQHPHTVLDCCVGIRHVYQRERERDLPSILASHQFAAVSQGPRLCSRTHTKPRYLSPPSQIPAFGLFHRSALQTLPHLVRSFAQRPTGPGGGAELSWGEFRSLPIEESASLT